MTTYHLSDVAGAKRMGPCRDSNAGPLPDSAMDFVKAVLPEGSLELLDKFLLKWIWYH